jgi:exosortase
VFPAGSGVVDDYIAASDPRTGARSGAPAAQGERAARGAARIANGLSTGWRMRKAVAAGLAIVGLFVWAFDATLANLWHVWQRNPDYSSGQLVPLCVLYMVMTRRESLRGLRIGMWPVGLLVFLAGITMHALGGAYAYSSMEYLGMVVCANGVAMSLIGRAGTRKLWYPLVFLFLMLPLPHRVHTTVMLPLQTVCAQLSETILETVGIPVARFGHVLEVEGYRVAVAEACSGLRMALAFLIVTGVVAFVVERPMWQKMIVVSSSIPIALACNVLRIVSAAYLYSVGYPWLAQGAFHDGAGLLMMPVALLLIFLEFRLLSNLAVSQQAVAALVERVDRARVASSG